MEHLFIQCKIGINIKNFIKTIKIIKIIKIIHNNFSSAETTTPQHLYTTLNNKSGTITLHSINIIINITRSTSMVNIISKVKLHKTVKLVQVMVTR